MRAELVGKLRDGAELFFDRDAGKYAVSWEGAELLFGATAWLDSKEAALLAWEMSNKPIQRIGFSDDQIDALNYSFKGMGQFTAMLGSK